MKPQLSAFPGRRGNRRAGLSAFLALVLLVFAAAIPGGGGRAGASGEPPLVACASSMRFAMEELAGAFASASGQKIRIAYGSSGNFTRQIMQGAPFAAFFSADDAYPLRLAEAGLTVDDGKAYALGRLALFVPKSSPLKPDASLADLGAALADGRLKRFAIASPEHAPYGRAAREVLQAHGLWDQMGPRLVLGENVAQAAQFASSGSAQGGIIAYSLALVPEMSRLGSYVLLAQEDHKALRQRVVLLKGADAAARAFYEFVSSEAARAILRKHGFEPPQKAD